MKKNLDYISGCFLLAFSLALLFSATKLEIWGDYGPSSGFFPTILSVLLGVFSLVIILRSWLQRDRQQLVRNILGPNRSHFFLYIFSFFAFCLVFSKIGYTLTLIGFLTFILGFVERQGWKTTFAIILISAIVSNLLFVRFLGVQLPEGPLSFFLRPL